MMCWSLAYRELLKISLQVKEIILEVEPYYSKQEERVV